MSTKNYGKWVCNRCGKQVSLCGLAQYQHAQWHKRQTAKSSGVAQRSTSPNTTKVDIPCFYACGNQHAGICMSVDCVCENRKLS